MPSWKASGEIGRLGDVDTFKTAWRFTKLSGSRWVTLGPSLQAVVVAALCSLGGLVSFIRSKVGAFPYHLGDFARFLERQRSSKAVLDVSACVVFVAQQVSWP